MKLSTCAFQVLYETTPITLSIQICEKLQWLSDLAPSTTSRYQGRPYFDVHAQTLVM